ncbi:MAG: S26 family signal peptidase, partial [Sphingomicrobium sp.]
MPERVLAPRRTCAERQVGHRVSADRRYRMAAWLTAALATAALSATVGWRPRPLLIWNRSESSPLGFYRVSPAGDLYRGAMVVAWLPPAMRRLAAARHYLPANLPLVKRVGAVEGDRVCAAGARIFINGRLAARRRDKDAAGRVMPRWEGCRRLGPGQVFLLSERGPS